MDTPLDLPHVALTAHTLDGWPEIERDAELLRRWVDGMTVEVTPPELTLRGSRIVVVHAPPGVDPTDFARRCWAHLVAVRPPGPPVGP